MRINRVKHNMFLQVKKIILPEFFGEFLQVFYRNNLNSGSDPVKKYQFAIDSSGKENYIFVP